ncbi:LolA family protein [Frondihabitans cladoniiphilus]|uniref:Sigma-E factor regulatory protein RseB domain-containing protein n=1 Tax=Frondihabitans cladoniiphilus TaxID=715785 RepID=A0ABP8VUR3_9MICO
MKKSTLRWIPAVAVPVVVIAGAVTVPAMANAAVSLPTKTADQIAALALKSPGASFTGTVQTTANLGFPDISSSALGGAGASGSDNSSISDALTQLTGTHKAKVYVDGTTASRIQTLDTLAERDLIVNGSSVWAYDSQKNTATHVTLPSAASIKAREQARAQAETQAPEASATPKTPQQLAQAFLAKIGPTTTVTTSDNVKVAGRKAYEIVLTPKDSTTLVGHVTLAVDASTGVPLKVTITAKKQTKAAYTAEFTSISFGAPKASVFTFTAPKGAKVTTLKTPTTADTSGQFKHPGALSQDGALNNATEQQTARANKAKAAYAALAPTVTGTGWSTIAGITLPAKATAGLTGSGKQSALLDQVLTKVDGGRVLQTALVSVYLTDSGKAYIGAVPASALEAAAAGK